MSDLMLTAVLSMPYDMAMADDLSRRQFYDRAQQALEVIERLTAERDEHAHWRRDLADKLHYRETDIIELRRQLAEAERDARRYRWLRENIGKWRIETYQTPEQSMVELHFIGDSCFYGGDSLDRIIDGQTRPAEE